MADASPAPVADRGPPRMRPTSSNRNGGPGGRASGDYPDRPGDLQAQSPRLSPARVSLSGPGARRPPLVPMALANSAYSPRTLVGEPPVAPGAILYAGRPHSGS